MKSYQHFCAVPNNTYLYSKTARRTMDSRTCTRCKVEKPLDQFVLRNRLTRLRQTHCIQCGSEMKADWHRRHKKEQVERAGKRRDEYKQKLREYVWEYLSTHPCRTCGESNPAALEFHHARGIKFKEISNILKNGASLKTLTTEIEKCDVLCANCHRKLTAKEQGWYTRWAKK